ncbi:hypothetical protein LHJMPILO_00525 [Aeromonas veronii]
MIETGGMKSLLISIKMDSNPVGLSFFNKN